MYIYIYRERYVNDMISLTPNNDNTPLPLTYTNKKLITSKPRR